MDVEKDELVDGVEAAITPDKTNEEYAIEPEGHHHIPSAESDDLVSEAKTPSPSATETGDTEWAHEDMMTVDQESDSTRGETTFTEATSIPVTAETLVPVSTAAVSRISHTPITVELPVVGDLAHSNQDDNSIVLKDANTRTYPFFVSPIGVEDDVQEHFEVDEEENDDDEKDNVCVGGYRQVLYEAFTDQRILTSFAVGAEIPPDVGFPVVHVDDDRIAYPLSKAQAKALCALGEFTPFGKGMVTVYDAHLLQVWRIDPSVVKINEQWLAKSLPVLVADIVE
jgi:hypothetical protein